MTLSDRAKIQILKYINGMDLQKSNKLPREEALADIIGVSRITIRSVLNDLACEGIVFRRQGRGTFVNVDSLNIKVKFNPIMEFTEMIRNSGYVPSVRLLNIQIIPRDQKIAEHLQLDKDDELVIAEKIFFADEKLCAFCADFFGLSVLGGETAFEEYTKYENSVFEYIYHQSGRRIEWDKVEIQTVLSTDIPNLGRYTDLKTLGLKPFLLLNGMNYDLDDKPLVFAREYIDTDIIRFSMIRQRNIHYRSKQKSKE